MRRQRERERERERERGEREREGREGGGGRDGRTDGWKEEERERLILIDSCYCCCLEL